jgi:hypothetical protein
MTAYNSVTTGLKIKVGEFTTNFYDGRKFVDGVNWIYDFGPWI